MDIFKITKPDRPWYEIILWWEVRRVPYNIVMCFIGLASFYIGYDSIPLVYLIIGFMLNAVYTLNWIGELTLLGPLTNKSKMKYPQVAFFGYLVVSTAIVFGYTIFL